MIDVKIKIVIVVASFATAIAFAADHPTPGVGPGANGAKYATDAYPGFDNTDEVVKPERKEPRWFAFINGPNRSNATEQLAYCRELIGAGSLAKAAKQLDALVREWPTSLEAPKAQQAYAELCLQLHDTEDAFEAYRYLLDFYSLQCDYEKIADKLYEVAGILKLEGKEIMFVRFENTVDVRRAYESCVLRSPGAKWVPEAMLIIGALREDEGKFTEAIKVYENLRNIYPRAIEAKTALAKEADVRMKLLREHEYNRFRCQDTIGFMRMALSQCSEDCKDRILAYLKESESMIALADYQSVKFYDSPTRTKRSAINAYERYLSEHPDSEYAEEIRARVAVLKEESK